MSIFLEEKPHTSTMCNRGNHKVCKNVNGKCFCTCHHEDWNQRIREASESSIKSHIGRLSI